MGLTVALLLDGVRAMAAAKAGCTDNDPVTAPNIIAWQMGTRRLRELLRPLGWDKDDTDTFATTVNHDLRIKLVVVNSDIGTGLFPGSPLNVARKGPMSRRYSETNRQLVLNIADFVAERMRKLQRVEIDRYATWCLCAYIDGDTVRAELSQAVRYSRGFVSDWHERILFLPDGSLADFIPQVTQSLPRDDGMSPDFPIEIRRK